MIARTPPISSTRSLLARTILMALCSALEISGQAMPRQAWRADPSFPSGHISKLAVDSAGNTLVCSGSNLGGYSYTGVHWFQVAKFDRAGQVLWTQDYRPAGGFTERAYWLAVDSQDNVIVTGYALQTQYNGPPRDIVTIKYDPEGNQLWAARFNGGGFGNAAYRVEVDALDNCYVLGAGNGGGGILQVLKYDPNGTMLWIRGYTPPSTNIASVASLAVTPGGRVAHTGKHGYNNFLTRVYDSSGNPEWTAIYPNGIDGATDVAFGPGGEVYVCGSGAIGGVLPISGVVVKYSQTGTLEWDTGFNSPGGPFDKFRRIEIAPGGDPVVVGQGYALPGSYLDWSIVRLDPSGSVLWARNYDGQAANDEFAEDLEIGADGSIYVLGQAGSPGSTGCTTGGSLSDVESVVVKYDAGGALQWARKADCSGHPTNLALGPNDSLSFTTPDMAVRFLQSPELLLMQAGGPGSLVSVTHQGLSFGGEYFTAVSTEPCPNGPGSGPYLGLCSTTPSLLIAQVSLPLGTPIFHFTAISETMAWGSFVVPPLTLEAVSFTLSGGAFGELTPVEAIVVQ